MERVWRIELQALGWKPKVLPLYDTRKVGSAAWARTRDNRFNRPTLYQLSYRGSLERMRRIELLSLDWQPKVIPLYDTRIGGPKGNRTPDCAVTGRRDNRFTMGPFI